MRRCRWQGPNRGVLLVFFGRSVLGRSGHGGLAFGRFGFEQRSGLLGGALGGFRRLQRRTLGLGHQGAALGEEVGLVASRWTPLGVVDPLTSQSLAPISLFLAEELTFVEATPEGTETIRRLRVPFAEAIEMVMRGEITHSGSCVVLLKAARLRSELPSKSSWHR